MINKKIKIFITFLFVLMLIMAGNFVFASNLKNNKSIHQIDSLKHLGIKANEFKSTEDIIPLSTLESPRVKKTILGYYPYWMDDSYKDLNYNLLTDIAFHAIFINSQGEIIDENGWPYVGLINKAHASGVRVILSFTNFNFDQIAELLDSQSNRQMTINNILKEIQDTDCDGANIDFEYVDEDQKEEFSIFMHDLTNTIHNNIPGSKVTIATPAIDWYGGMDFNYLAENTDGLNVMTYDYHWAKAPQAGPISPFSNSNTWGVHNVVNSINNYLLETNDNKAKVILGVPYYGYDFKVNKDSVPANSQDTAESKTYAEIMKDSDNFNKIWDEDSLTPYYKYGEYHQVWYEDPESISYKYNLVNTKDLGGIGIWALGYDGSQSEMWNKIDEYFGLPNDDFSDEVENSENNTENNTEVPVIESIITAAGVGGGPHIRAFNNSGEVLVDPNKLFAYGEDFKGGVRVATGDIDADGEDEIITAPRAGGGPQVRVFEKDGTPRGIDFWPYDMNFRGGIDVAAGDIDSDGKDEIAVIQASQGQALVKVYRYNVDREIIGEWNVFGNFEGGGSIVMGDIDMDGRDEIIVGAGEGGGPQIRVFEADGTLKPIQFFAFHPDYRGGIDVAAGDTDGDGKDEIGVCQMNEQAWCKVYRYNSEQTIIGEWKAFADFPVGGLIDMGHIDNDGLADVVVGAGNAGGPQVRAFKAEGVAIRETNFFAYDVNFRGGVDVAVGFLGN